MGRTAAARSGTLAPAAERLGIATARSKHSAPVTQDLDDEAEIVLRLGRGEEHLLAGLLLERLGEGNHGLLKALCPALPLSQDCKGVAEVVLRPGPVAAQPPAKPLQGKREAWPQRVCWLPCFRVPRARGSAALVAGLPVFPLAGLDVGNRNGNEVAAILERSDMVSFEAAGTVARSTAPAVALEGGVADASPPGSLQRSQAHAGARLSNSLAFAFQDKSPCPIR